jgi:lipoprotein-releasing system ATP-binding protein
VYPGESVAIMGKSGEGKSTLLHILGTLEEPTMGELFLLNQKVEFSNCASIRNRHIGFVFQAFNLLEEETLLENILLPAKIGRQSTHSSSPIYERALMLLESVELLEKKHCLARQLSGGEKQRAAIARALLNHPDIILADEPSGNLDAHNAQKIQHLLLNATRLHKKTLILATHDPELAALCDRQLHLREGALWNL